MSIETMIEAGMNVFKTKLSEFCSEICDEPLSPDTAEMMARGLHKALAAMGVAAYREYLESHETNQDIVIHQGEAFRFKYNSKKKFVTLFGPMRVTRRVYQNANDTKSHVPLDTAWGMENEFLSREVREAVAFSCAHVTPLETHELLKKSAMFHPHPTQMKRAIEHMGQAISEHVDALDSAIRSEEKVPEQTRVLAASLDGVNVLLREENTAQRGRPVERPGGGNPQSSNSSYRNATVGAISLYGPVEHGKATPQRLCTRYVAHMPEESAPTLKAKFEAELDAVELLLPEETVKVLVCDGARNLWNYIEQNERFNGYEKIIDYWHALEHLSAAAEALFGKGNEQGKGWYTQRAKELLKHENGAKRLLRSMTYFEHQTKLSKSRQEALRAQRTFFLRNQNRMHYAEFRRRGLPIGSGPVEAACKTLVKTRMCRSGMRWLRDGGQNILALRTYVKSNLWDAFWKHFNELERTG